MALYTETVMDHFMHPRNVGEIADADGVGEVGNAKCGDIMKMYLKIKDNKIEDVKFETFGCGSAIASSSIATEMIKGRTLEDALALTNQGGRRRAGRPACAQAALLRSGRGGCQVRHSGLLREKPHRVRPQQIPQKGRLRVLLPDGITKRTGRGHWPRPGFL